MRFEVLVKDPASHARLGRMELVHGIVETPVFMPVGSAATVKAMAPNELEEIGAKIILGNAYHLYLRPGLDVIGKFGGLHDFMGWKHPILTDSGGFQVFSLARLRKITDEGIEFSSHIDGAACFIGPTQAMHIQHTLNSDIVMCFDECTPYPCEAEYIDRAVDRTLKWAAICRQKHAGNPNALFGIIQGGMFLDKRAYCAQKMLDIGFDGYAIGGLSVGEPAPLMYEMIDGIEPFMPADKPRYLMGCGTPLNLLQAVSMGIDMFDCVMPTRNARNGQAFTKYGTLTVRNSLYKEDRAPVEDDCGCYCCRHFSRAYVRHLLNANEILGSRLLSYHNIHFYVKLMENVRAAISNGSFTEFKKDFESSYKTNK